jgi:hypothetical protein
LALRNEDDDTTPSIYLIESHTCPTAPDNLKSVLEPDETFQSDFIGASEEDCQQWTREMAPKVNFIVPDVLVIADARGAEDDTVLVQSYQAETTGTDEDLEPTFPPFGILPPPDKANTWWSFRVKRTDALQAMLDLGEFGIPETVLAYYGYKERLTDEQGVFDVARASRITLGEDPEAVLSEVEGTAPEGTAPSND